MRAARGIRNRGDLLVKSYERLIGSGSTDAGAYQRVARERYRLIRVHEWNDEIIERLRTQLR